MSLLLILVNVGKEAAPMSSNAARCLGNFLPVTAFLVFTGCTPAVHKALSPADVTAITQTNVRAVVVQDEVSIALEKSTSGDVIGAGGGVCCILVGSMVDKAVDKSRSERAEKWLTPLLQQTTDVDFRKDYWDAVLPSLRSLPWLKLGETELGSAGEVPESWLKDDVLKVTASYQLTSDSRRLVVGSLVQLWTHPKPKLKSKPSYFAFHTYVSKPVGGGAGEAAVAKWAANGAEIYRAALREGIQESMRMMRLDLPDAELKSQHLMGSPARIWAPGATAGRLDSFRGEILDRDSSRVVVRHKNGNLQSLSLAEITIEEKGRQSR